MAELLVKFKEDKITPFEFAMHLEDFIQERIEQAIQVYEYSKRDW